MIVVHDAPSEDLYGKLLEPVLAVTPQDMPAVNRHVSKFAVTETNDAGALVGGAYAFVHPG